MTEQSNNLTKLITDCWKDAELKARFQTNPSEVLAEYGMEVPGDVCVHVVENSEGTIHITLPPAPANHQDLSDSELENAAGGTFYSAGGAPGHPCNANP